MSDNPFATPETYAATSIPKPAKKTPGALTAILIISLVLGILGLLGSCVGVAGIVVQASINVPNQDPFQKQMQELQKQQFVPNVINLGLNFIVSPLLILGAIGGLNRKAWGQRLLSAGLLVAAIYVVLRTVLTTIIQIGMMGPMKEAMAKGLQQQGGNIDQKGAEFVGSIMQFGFIFGLIVAIVWALLLVGFYLWSWTYLRKDEIKAYFGVV